jgi:hypothetical protein
VQRDAPYVVYTLNTPASNGQFLPFSTFTTQTASVVDGSLSFSTSNTLAYYQYPLVAGNNISSYISPSSPNNKIKVPGLKFFSRAKKDRSYSVEFWMRHFGNDYTTPKQIVSLGNSASGGLWIDQQSLVYIYGDSPTASNRAVVSMPIDKFDEPMHIVMGHSKGQIQLIVNGNREITEFDDSQTINSSFSEESIYINPYVENNDYIYFGGLQNMEISCIAMYLYNIAATPAAVVRHYVYGQGYTVNESNFKSRGGFNYSMHIDEKDVFNNISIGSADSWKNFNSTRKDASQSNDFNAIYVNNRGFLTLIPDIFSENVVIDDENFIKNIYPTSVLHSASGYALQKGIYIEFENIQDYINTIGVDYGIEASLMLTSSAASVGSIASTIAEISAPNLGSQKLWIYQERVNAGSNRTKYQIYNTIGTLTASGFIGASVTTGSAFSIGFGIKNRTYTLYQKLGAVTASVEFNLNDSRYIDLQDATNIRFGSRSTYSGGTEYKDISDDYSAYPAVYLSSIKIGDLTDISTGTNIKYYKNYRYDYTSDEFKTGIYNASISYIFPAKLFAKEINDNSIIYPNRIDVGYPNQENNASAVSSVKTVVSRFYNNSLTSSSRIYSSNDTFIQPTTLTNSTISACAVTISFVFNTDDVLRKNPAVRYLNIFSMANNNISLQNSAPPIELNYLSTSSVTTPAKIKTPFINNSAANGGLLIGDSGYFGKIDTTSIPVENIKTISFFVKSASAYSSTILQISGSTVFSYTNQGASATVNFSVANSIYCNGASVTLSGASFTISPTAWNRYDIVLTNPISSGASIIIGAQTGANNRFYIDELGLFNRQFTADDAASLYNLYRGGSSSATISIKDGGIGKNVSLSLTYGASSESASYAALNILDKEMSASYVTWSDKLQLFTKESLTFIDLIKTTTSSLTQNAEGGLISKSLQQAEQYVDGVLMEHGDKVLVFNGTACAVYTASVTTNSFKIYSASPVTASQVFFITSGVTYKNRYMSVDILSSSTVLNPSADRYKVKFYKKTNKIVS